MTGNAGRIAGHGITNTAHNGLATHNQLNGARNQWAHNQLGHNQFAHNQFAAQNFHGLNNFNHTGFNRNAFGNNANWNHWGEHFWGAGWNNWGWGWGGWAGPVFWPFLLGDVFSFVFWLPITIRFGGTVLLSSSPASSRPVPISGSITATDLITTVTGTGLIIRATPVRRTSTTTALAATTLPLAGDTPPGPNKLIARRLPKPIPRRWKVALA
jgi:hypothetical protein